MKISKIMTLSCSEFVETNKEYFEGISEEIDQVLVRNSYINELIKFKKSLD